MEEIYCIAALSGYNHQEGYLDIMLRKLYLENKATFGYDPYDERLVRILFDEMDNPYLLYKLSNKDLVEAELRKKIIIPEIVHEEFSNLHSIADFIDKDNLHDKIQQDSSPFFDEINLN
ncbi:MAG: hypothetical protein AABW45_01815 [Nanoarchaeota archaeon]